MNAVEARKLTERRKFINSHVILKHIEKEVDRGWHILFWYSPVEEKDLEMLRSLGYSVRKNQDKVLIISW